MTVTFKFGDNTEVPFAELPESSQQGIVNRGGGHIFGNEVASQVVGKARATIAESLGIKTEAVTTAQVQAYRATNPNVIRDWALAFQSAKKDDILAGKLGVRAAGGGGVDPLTREMNKIAAAELAVILEAHGLKLPRGDETLTMRGKPMTRGDLVAAHLAKHGEKVETEAKRVLAAAKRKNDALAETAKGTDVADMLGL